MRTTLLAAVVTSALIWPAAAHAAPAIIAHRGGPVTEGAPAFAEETLPAFRNAWEQHRAILEFDAKLTKDRVPVVIHDDTLDRTTTCTGPVKDIDAAAYKACRADVIGSGFRTRPAPQPADVLTLRELLDWANGAGATLLMEIKNVPEDNDFDPTSAYADTVMDTVIASGFPPARLIVQSFRFENLDAARAKLPGVQLMYLTSVGNNASGIATARDRGYQWWSPSGIPSEATIRQAHAARVKVSPYTINDFPPMLQAAESGADAIHTDDPTRARRAFLTVKVTPQSRSLASARRRGYVPVRVSGSDEGEIELVLQRGDRVLSRLEVKVTKRAKTVRLRVRKRDLSGRRVALALQAGTATTRITLR